MKNTKLYFLGGLVFILINLVAYFLDYRLDLTEDKRFTVSPSSKNVLESLNKDINITVYLNNDNLPSGFERLKRAIEVQLSDFKSIAGSSFSYEFIDPNAILDPNERSKLINELIEKGMQPTNVLDTKAGQKSEILVFPYALVSDGEKETKVLLLKGNQGLTAQEKLNQSYENVEYELITAINRLNTTEKKNIGLITEFTSVLPVHFTGLINSLNANFNLFILDVAASKTFEGLDALIMLKPSRAVDDSTKYKIDQFVMNGGKSLFFVDGLSVDSIGLQGTYAQPLNHNLSDLFFKYGVRINANIVKDGLNCAVIPMVVGDMGDEANIQPMPYRYFPLINNFGKSLITKNLDMVYTRFAASIDTVASTGIKKTPLLISSPYTKVLTAPALVSYNDARKQTDREEYQAGPQTIAYLLEGSFNSLYKNRMLAKEANFREKSPETAVFVCSDGDLVYNETNKDGEAYPLGYDKYTKHSFANTDFVLNVLNYMLDKNGIISSKAKSIKIRPLDKVKIKEERLYWQLFNTLLPLAVLGLLGAIIFMISKNKYS